MAAECCSAGETSGLANTLQSHVDDIRTLIQCGICIRPLYEPFTLALSIVMVRRRKIKANMSRLSSTRQIATGTSVRAVVQMFTARAELLDKGETTMEHIKHRQEEAGRLEEDKANNHPTQGGLFGGLFKPKVPPLKPVIDIDDGVMRCPHCSWELEEGEQCANCGYRYRPGSETDGTESSDENDSGSDDDSDGMDDDDSEDSEDDSEDIEDAANRVWGSVTISSNGVELGSHPLRGAFPSEFRTAGEFAYPIPEYSVPYDPNAFDYEEDEDEDENEYDHEDSFINDGTQITSGDYESDSGHSTVVTSSQRNERPILFNHHTDGEDDSESSSGEEEDSNSDSDDSELSDEDDIRAVPARQAFGNTRQSTWLIPTSPWMHRRQDAPTPSAETIDSGSGSEEEEEETSDRSEPPSSSPPPAPSRPNTVRGLSARNAITLDDSDDEQPIGPVRRNTHRRRNRYSPY
ncbi:hypothetical protein PENANT_c010G08343 [Penicillium antarcticum]|uniref:Uncharacterized protein n=1 Tax=Penicillium antarcticum TaxID=416450 RepID=A0A1V6Q7V0_9EURO|nr:hypothetical protein PENANT_c010G08343 [Penicillium antarcticum]